MAYYESSFHIEAPQEELFDLFSSPWEMAKINPPKVVITLISAPQMLEQGSRVVFQVQSWGQTQLMEHEIIIFEPHHRIVEIQVKGPMKSWRHEHLFLEGSGNQTEIQDKVLFEPPGGMLGFIMTQQRISKYLAEGFEYRHQELVKRWESETN